MVNVQLGDAVQGPGGVVLQAEGGAPGQVAVQLTVVLEGEQDEAAAPRVVRQRSGRNELGGLLGVHLLHADVLARKD